MCTWVLPLESMRGPTTQYNTVTYTSQHSRTALKSIQIHKSQRLWSFMGYSQTKFQLAFRYCCGPREPSKMRECRKMSKCSLARSLARARSSISAVHSHTHTHTHSHTLPNFHIFCVCKGGQGLNRDSYDRMQDHSHHALHYTWLSLVCSLNQLYIHNLWPAPINIYYICAAYTH